MKAELINEQDAPAKPNAAIAPNTADPPPANKDATREDSSAQAPKPMTNDDVLKLVAAGRKIYGVSVRTSTLEEVYLDAVGGETS